MESALQASLGVASQAAKPLGRGVRGEGAGARVGRARGFKSWVADLYL